MTENKRFFVLDLLRGVAVFLMVLAHAVFFFHNSTDQFLLSLQKIGNTVCFTTFFLVSGTILYIAYLSHNDWTEKKNRLLKRILLLTSAYYILAFFVSINTILTTYGYERWGIILNILAFRNIPSFTEFIPPFIFYALLVYLFPLFFRRIAKSIALVVGFSVVFYFAGYFLYTQNLPSFLTPWQSLLSGKEGYFRFPIYQYFPILALGLFWGNFLTMTRELEKKIDFSKVLIIFSLGLSILSGVFYFYFFGTKNILLRWPPSISFLSFGLLFASASSWFFYKTKQLKNFPTIRDFILVLGQNAFAIFFSHIFIMQIYGMSGGTKVGSSYVFFFLFFLTLIFTVALAKFIPFNLKFNLTFHRGSHDEQEELIEEDPFYRVGEEGYEEIKKEAGLLKRFFFPRSDGTQKARKLIRKRHALFASILIVIASFVFLPSVIEEREKVKSAKASFWWSEDFAYNLPFAVKNNESFSSIPSGSTLKILFDHKKLVTEKKSMLKGEDIRILSWDGKEYKNLEFWLDSEWAKNDTALKFIIKDKIASGKEAKFFIYYGNFAAVETVKTGRTKEEWDYKYTINTLNEESHPYIALPNKLWFIHSNLSDENGKLTISFKPEKKLKDAKVNYEIMGQKLKGELLSSDGEIWEALVIVKDLKPGIYRFQVTANENGTKYKSQRAAFYVSYPLYVTWTIDWEGYDVTDAFLNVMAKIANKHKMPMTQLFNPRIYTSGLSKERQEYLTNWVKEREKKYDDEIGLHLHMFYDFVTASGVEPKKTPNWGDDGDGYGSLTSNYNEEEMTKILTKALDLFSQNNINKPETFRAGGWFASLDTLKALQNVGILADTSGRTSYEFGKNKLKGHWDLLATAQPYKPSSSNQNITGNSNLDLWEIPNNGADSYWFKTDDLIQRFKSNYRGGILEKEKQVTYLSHPHWFNLKEQEKIEKTLLYIDNFRYENDSGPVIYVRLKDILEDWLNNDKY